MQKTALLLALLPLFAGCHSSSGCCQDGECATDSAGQGGTPASDTGSLQLVSRGTSSGLRERKSVVVRSEEEWTALWRRHAGERLPSEPAPKIDFAKQMVVAVVLGERPTAGYDVEVTQVAREGDSLVVHSRELRPAPDSLQAQVITCPYSFVVVPRFDGEVRFLEE